MTAEPSGLLGFPLAAWSFAARTFVAMMAALYAAFWLQLEGASSAMVCVAILALPTRGHVFQKTIFRSVGTVVGVAASIALAGLFPQTPELFILGLAAWLGLCIYVASFFGGYRAYGAVLSGYTVAVVAAAEIDTPNGTFLAGVNRGAAITVGIAALALVNGLFAAPDTYPGLVVRLRLAKQKVDAFLLEALRAGAYDPTLMASAIQSSTAFQADVATLAGEGAAGPVRAAAARSAVAAFGEEMAATRAFLGSFRAVGDGACALRAKLAAVLEERMRDPSAARSDAWERIPDDGGSLEQRVVAGHARDLLDRERLVSDGLAGVEAARPPERSVRLSAHRVRQVAWRNTFRGALAVAAAGTIFALAGWPDAILSVVLVCVIASLGTTAPDPQAFSKLALLGVPIAAALAGVVEFVVLDGADDFVIFMSAMAPPVFALCLLMTHANPVLKGLATLVLLFFCVLLAPGNPQSYDAESFLFTSVLASLGAVTAFVLLGVVLPISDEQRRRWLLDDAKEQLREARADRNPPLKAERTFSADDRLAQLIGLKAGREDVVAMLFLADLAAAVVRAHGVLDDLRGIAGAAAAVERARAQLERLDPALLRDAADRVDALATGGDDARPQRAAAAALAWVSMLASQPERMREIGGC